MSDAVWKILGTGGAVVAGFVATKVADTLWEKAGQDKVIDPTDPDSPMMTALAYAALTGLAAGLAKTLATRKAAQYYAKSTGHKPSK